MLFAFLLVHTASNKASKEKKWLPKFFLGMCPDLN